MNVKSMKQTVQQANSRDEYGYPSRPDTRRKWRNLAVSTSKSILFNIIYLFMSIIGCFLWLARMGKSHHALTVNNFHPRRILVIRMDLIGVLVMALTVVRALRHTYPEAEIDLLAIPASAKVVAFDPDLSQIISYDPNIWRRPKTLVRLHNWREALALRRRMRQRHYDLAVSVFGPWAAILAVLSGAPRRVGFGKESYPGFMTDRVAGRHWQPQD